MLFFIFVTVSSRMSDTAELITSEETQDVVSSLPPPPPYTYQGQDPPPYSATPAMYCPPKVETTCPYQPTTYVSFRDINPELADTTPLTASSSFDDKIVRQGFVRKVCTTYNSDEM